jgi:hypothetical protein
MIPDRMMTFAGVQETELTGCDSVARRPNQRQRYVGVCSDAAFRPRRCGGQDRILCRITFFTRARYYGNPVRFCRQAQSGFPCWRGREGNPRARCGRLVRRRGKSAAARRAMGLDAGGGSGILADVHPTLRVSEASQPQFPRFGSEEEPVESAQLEIGIALDAPNFCCRIVVR